MSANGIQIFSEFLGTLILILLGDGVVAGVSLAKSKAKDAGWVAITLGWGLAVTIGVFAASYMGPAHLNPAVTLGMAMTGNFEWSLVVPFILAQTAGAIVGGILVWVTYLPHWEATENSDAILGVFATGPAIKYPIANMVTELIGTFVLVFSLLAFTQSEFSNGLNPVVVGLLIVSIGLSLGGPTGYAINPARDFGPRLAHQLLPIKNKGTSNWGYAWVPVVGPFIGGALAALIWGVIPI
ncbi:MIP/aquaporin family protein [Vagococcus vulneris]|uniref:Aquaporin n=1 Tax=Vagococcus vulneris TaxID=1977869 RepID=A0A430A0A5_9ENTE|nr:MIP/aquaporin family protein [Vagococcus vulneris]RST99762.1 aquaporin [Vagococcus vulneris]